MRFHLALALETLCLVLYQEWEQRGQTSWALPDAVGLQFSLPLVIG